MNREHNLKKVTVFGIIFALIIVILVSAVIFDYNNKKQTPPVVNMHLDLVDRFDSVDSLKSQSTLIALIEVTNTRTYEYEDVPFTLSNAVIKKLYKNTDADKNISSINILETGGEIDKLNYVSDGNSVFKPSDEAIVFLEKYIGPVAEDAYVIKGAYQGKFKLSGNKLIPPLEVSDGLQKINSIQELNLN